MITKAEEIREKAHDNQCSPAIWGNFNPEERKLWMKFYESFLISTNFAVGWDGKDEEKEFLREVTAHNMACRAVWILQDADML